MSSEQEQKRGITLTPSTLLIGALVTAVILLAVLLIISLRDGEPGNPTPTPFADSGPALGSESLVVGISDSDTISVTLDMPSALQVGAQNFPVRAQAVGDDGSWTPAFDSEGTAVWVYGSIVNYIIGLSDTEANRALLENMTPSDQMRLTTRNGIQYAFAFNNREEVLVGNPDIYAQQSPGLTLLLVGTTGETRLMVNGRYIADETSSATGGQGSLVELGETAQLDNVQITVTGASYLSERPEAQPGFAFYLIDYQIQNTGLTALESGRLRLTLQDELGNQYAVSPAAGQLGNYPTLSGSLNAGQTMQATAGYQIPLGLNSANVLWLASNDVTGAQLQVTIPFGGGAQSAKNAQVTLTQADVSADLTGLTLKGTILNLGEQAIIVAEKDIALRVDDGSAYLQQSTNPPFPWTVAPGQSLPYVVSFQKPVAVDNAVFTILNQSFQLSNLR